MAKENINSGLAKLTTTVASLHTDEHNARIHDQRGLDLIAHSLSEYGQQKPIVALDDGTVIAGNGTLMAAMRLGWKKIAVVRFSDAAKARAYAIADNRASELSKWNIDTLLDAFDEIGGVPAIDVGFAVGDVQDLIDRKQTPFVTLVVDVSELKPHPRNYQTHPADQLQHIIRSIETHGFYRNVVVARDNTILAGHGVVEAVKQMGRTRVPIIRLDIDANDPKALKVLTSDNEIGNLADTDDRALTGLLKELFDIEGSGGLLGTGFDENQLAVLAMVTRPVNEVADINEAAAWVGMPEYEPLAATFKIIVSVADEAAIAEVHQLLGHPYKSNPDRLMKTISLSWPPKSRDDVASIAFVSAESAASSTESDDKE